MNKNKYALSIITICYNEKQIERTCQSIVDQTWQDFEWIVVDGGSTDGTLDVLNKYRDRINILISEPDKGIYNAMNKGIKLATGKWLNFMNGGDRFYNNCTLEQIFKNKTYHADVLYGRCMLFDNELYLPHDYVHNLTMSYFRDSSLCHQSSFIKRELFNLYGLYNENYKVVSDYEKFVIFFKNNCTFQYIPDIVSLFDSQGISTLNWKKCKSEHEKAYFSIVKNIKQYDVSFFKYFRFTKKIPKKKAITI